MSHQVTLPSGATAVLRDPEDLTFGEREDVLAGLNVDLGGQMVRTSGQTGGQMLVDFQRAVISLGVESWSLTGPDGQPLPVPSVDPTALRQLKARDGAFLFDQLQPIVGELFPDFSVGPTGSPTTP